MAGEIGGTNVQITGDVKGLLAAIRDGKASIADFTSFIENKVAAATTKAERSQDSFNKSVAKLSSELRGGGATAQLGMLAAAFEKLERDGRKLEGVHLQNFIKQVEALKAQGGTVPAALSGISHSVSGLDAALKGQGL